MLTNEIIFFIIVFIQLSLTIFAFGLGRDWLYALLIANLALITMSGAELVTVFGYTTNIGNIFYASVFLVGQLLAQHERPDAAYRAIYLGIFGIVVVAIMSPFIVGYHAAESLGFTGFQFHSFTGAPRIALASASAFLFSQGVNIWVYRKIMRKTRHRLVWLRSATATVLGQFIDSILFFTIAFYGFVSGSVFFEVMAVGFAVKCLVGFLGIGVIYGSITLKKSR